MKLSQNKLNAGLRIRHLLTKVPSAVQLSQTAVPVSQTTVGITNRSSGIANNKLFSQIIQKSQNFCTRIIQKTQRARQSEHKLYMAAGCRSQFHFHTSST